MMNQIVLDPGHGGSQRRGNSSPGVARFGSGQLEKQITYALAERVSRHLGGAVRMTRKENENRALSERIQVARSAHAGAFVSLHSSPETRAAGIWVHPRSSPDSLRLAESIRRQLAPAYGGPVQISRGELAVLSPDHHDRDTAACLVELGMAGPANLDGAAAAIARGVRGHFGARQYGHGPERHEAHGLDLIAPPTPLPSDPLAAMQAINDWLTQRLHFITPVPDTSFFPFSAICRLELPDGWGTGFFVSPNRILTAGHVTNGATTIDVVPGKNGAGHEPFGRFTVTGADIITHPSFSPGGDFDLGVLRVSTPPPNGRYFDNLDTTPHSVSGGVAICGYAADVGADDSQHIDGDYLREVSANLEQADYGANTMPGTSGSPVFYTVSVDDQAAQQCRIDIGVQGVHVASPSVGSTPDSQVNKCVMLNDNKVNWLWSL